MNVYLNEEIRIGELPEEGKFTDCVMYLLLLNYHINFRSETFVTFYGTDFTTNYNRGHPHVFFDDCKLRNGIQLPLDKVVLFETGRRHANAFLSSEMLPVASKDPPNNIYSSKVFLKVSGRMKRYRDIIDFGKCNIQVMKKSDVINSVNRKDTKLIRVLQNIIKYCPSSWREELDHKYGIWEMADEIGVAASQNSFVNEFQTQPDFIESQAQYHNPLNLRHLNDPCGSNLRNVAERNLVQDIVANLVKQESNDDQWGLTASVLGRENNIPSTQYEEVTICGMYPPLNEKIIIDSLSGQTELLDSFEIYFKITNDAQIVKTLSFRDSNSVYNFIGFDGDIKPQIEPKLKLFLENKFSQGSKMKLEKKLYQRFKNGEIDIEI
ncbi:hypothetical protein CAS74_001008 [Pichia kudriavzevii]|uniref:Uncharacterized protein n=1 Tax=Pichia kudriavzevii TaxID=4909 RepID=A0A1Z8JVJ7_PICKU|nr:hypothetical protein CAS74_001008 [Pichia kudriavzevii]